MFGKKCPLRTGHVIRCMRCSSKRIVNGGLWVTSTHNFKSRTDRRRIFKLGGGIVHVTRHVRPVSKVERSKVKVTDVCGKNFSRTHESRDTVHAQWLSMSMAAWQTSQLIGQERNRGHC